MIHFNWLEGGVTKKIGQFRTDHVQNKFTTIISFIIPWVILLDIRKSVSYNSGRSCFEYFCKQIECGGDIYFERKEKGALQKSLDSNFKIKGMVIRII